MAVADAQHLLAVVVVAAGLAPQIGRLQRRHQQLDRAGAILLLAHDRADLVQHPQAERQPGVDAGAFLPDHAGAQHQPVRDDFRLLRRFLEHRQEIAGEAHGLLGFREIGRASDERDSQRKRGSARASGLMAPSARRGQVAARPRQAAGSRFRERPGGNPAAAPANDPCKAERFGRRARREPKLQENHCLNPRGRTAHDRQDRLHRRLPRRLARRRPRPSKPFLT